MSIRRAPRPEHQFLMVRNDVCRDDRLSYRALGLLVSMLSYPDNWTFATDRLAKGEGREGEKAIRTALKELEQSGYLVRRRLKADGGRFVWEHVLYDTPQNPQVSDITAGQTMRQESTSGERPGGNRRSQEDHQEDHHEDVCSDVVADAPTAKSWRDQDLDLFKDILGAPHVRRGDDVWPVETLYKQLVKTKRMEWPGRYLQALDAAEYSQFDSIDEYLETKFDLETTWRAS